MRRKYELPPVAQDYVRHRPAAVPLVTRFHRWIDRHHITLNELTPSHIQGFLRGASGTVIGEASIRPLTSELRLYMGSLHRSGATRLAAPILVPHQRRQYELHPVAEDFVQQRMCTKRPRTLQGYRVVLHGFHQWLQAQHCELRDVDRNIALLWMRHLHDRGLTPGTQVGRIAAVRLYLRYVNDRRLLEPDADQLIKAADFPKVPTYLPRPLPPEADASLQTRLSDSDDLYDKGLLLMRLTGLRIGELTNLAYDCLRSDDLGRHFLKVPLGKLHNERLVPLEPRARQIIETLKKRPPHNRLWLLSSRSNSQTQPDTFRDRMRNACKGLDIHGPVVPHRLRHSYATTLLNAGMSLPAVMRLLGHRDYRMTLRYASVTLETVGQEYHEALKHLEHRYKRPLAATASLSREPIDPCALLADTARWLRGRAADQPTLARKAAAILKRLERISRLVDALKRTPQ